MDMYALVSKFADSADTIVACRVLYCHAANRLVLQVHFLQPFLRLGTNTQSCCYGEFDGCDVTFD